MPEESKINSRIRKRVKEVKRKARPGTAQRNGAFFLQIFLLFHHLRVNK